MRLDKYLSECTGKTRSQVKALVKKGLVTVDGVPAKSPDMKIDETSSAVTMDGKTLSYEKYVYYMLNKPEGYVSATNDNLHKTVIDLLSGENTRDLFPVGRLDIDTVGLLIITNDGEFAHNMLSPKKHVEKKYIAQLDGEITEEMISDFENGIVFADGTRCMPAKLEISGENPDKTTAIVTICEGKFHQVKKMFAVCGKNVVHLKRISIGDLYLDSNLHIGETKMLSELDKMSIFMCNMH